MPSCDDLFSGQPISIRPDADGTVQFAVTLIVDPSYDFDNSQGPAIQGAWRVEYSDHGRSDVFEFPPLQATSAPVTLEYKSDVILGGTIRAEFAIRLKRRSDGTTFSLSCPLKRSVIGINPKPSEARNELAKGVDQDVAMALSVTAFRESGFLNFDNRGENAGKPRFGKPRGFGIMQLDTPPPTVQEIWNWKQNVTRGKELFTQKVQDAKSFTARMRARYHDDTIPDLAGDDLKLEIYQRYNGGSFHKWDPAKRQWVENSANKALSYARKSLQLEKDVRDGKYPVGWQDRPDPTPMQTLEPTCLP